MHLNEQERSGDEECNDRGICFPKRQHSPYGLTPTILPKPLCFLTSPRHVLRDQILVRLSPNCRVHGSGHSLTCMAMATQVNPNLQR